MKPEMIYVAGGAFFMGSSRGADDEQPVHEVFVDPFFIGKSTITRGDYDLFLKENQQQEPPLWNEPHFSDPLQPVVAVNWFDAIRFCDWLSKRTGSLFRLPTEAEWEFAATAGDPDQIYPWGKRSWEEWPELHDRFQNGPEPVCLFPPNRLGIHDMGMNVHEWCMDWYAPDYYVISPLQNPSGPAHGSRRSSRGGSWRHQIKITRCSARSSIPPEYRYADYGFRVVCVP